MYPVRKIRTFTNMVLLSITILLSYGCTQDTSGNEKNFSQQKEELVEQLHQKQAELDSKIEQLQKEAKSLKRDAQYKTQKTIEKLKKEKSKIVRSSKKVKNATEDQWKKIQKESQNLIEKTGITIDHLEKEIKQWLK